MVQWYDGLTAILPTKENFGATSFPLSKPDSAKVDGLPFSKHQLINVDEVL